MVPAGWVTDLSTLPRVLECFVPRSGVETLPSLLQDYLVTDGLREGTVSSVDEADRIFLRALEAVGVPPLRRYIIASAATFVGRWRRSSVSRLAVAIWTAMMTAASVLGVYVSCSWAGGKAYRAAVIGSGGHAQIVVCTLQRIADSA